MKTFLILDDFPSDSRFCYRFNLINFLLRGTKTFTYFQFKSYLREKSTTKAEFN